MLIKLRVPLLATVEIIYFYWIIVVLQYCASFCCKVNQPHIYIYLLFLGFFFPIYVTTEHWVEFLLLHNQFSLVTYLVWACVLSHDRLFVIPWTIARQAPLSIEFSIQEILEWVAVSFSKESSQLRGSLEFPAWASGFFTTCATWHSGK